MSPGADVARAAGDDNVAIGTITLLNRQALAEYQALRFAEAQRLLDQALDLAASAGLSAHPVRARTYVTLGIVTAGGLKRRDVAVRLFRKALQIQPEIQLSRELASPDVQEAFEEAVRGLGTEPKQERLPSELLVHEPVRAASRGDAILVAATPDESLHADRLLLAYRPGGSSAYAKVPMRRQDDGVFEGVIPALATGASEVAYYIEARDLDDRLIAARGSPIAPMLITLAEARTEQRRAEAPPAQTERRVIIGLLVGTGMGWASGPGEVTTYDAGKGKLAWSRLLHLAPQIGYFVAPRFLIAVAGRFQIVTGATEYLTPVLPSTQCGGDGFCKPARGAVAGFLKGAWFFTGPDSPLRPYVSLSIGGGYVRHVVDVTVAADATGCGRDQDKTCVDTVAVGPLLGGAGLGFSYRLSAATQVIVAVEALVGAPRIATDLDANLGVAVAF